VQLAAREGEGVEEGRNPLPPLPSLHLAQVLVLVVLVAEEARTLRGEHFEPQMHRLQLHV